VRKKRYVIPDRSPPKLVHKILFSMPAGVPPKKVLEAAEKMDWLARKRKPSPRLSAQRADISYASRRLDARVLLISSRACPYAYSAVDFRKKSVQRR
jgi:hypothetical protein